EQGELGSGDASIMKFLGHFFGALHIADIFLLRDLIKRRPGHINMPLFYQLLHLPIEKGQKQRTDVLAVDVGIGQDNNLAVAQAADVLDIADIDADRGDDAAYLLVAEDLLRACLLYVERFATQWQDGLEHPVA